MSATLLTDHPLALLTRNPGNPRVITPTGREALRAQLQRHGHLGTLVARRLPDGQLLVLGGNQRLDELVDLGQTTTPTWIIECNDADADHLALVLNGHAGTWDEQALTNLLRQLAATGEDLAALGLQVDAALDRALEAVHGTASGPADPDDSPEPQNGPWNSVAGGVYELGPHRLVCGDSTSRSVWQQLLAGETVDMVFTDPPYGIDYEGAAGKLANDDLDEEQLELLIRASCYEAREHCRPGAPWYVAAPGGPLFHVFGGVLRELAIWHQTIVWAKDQFVLSRSDYHNAHEPIFAGAAPDEAAHLLYGWTKGGRRTWRGGRRQDTVWHFPRPKRSIEHPTMKPVALVERAITNSSLAGQKVADFFGGSGTTLIAAARTGRHARLIELDPRFCDVIRRRWTTHARAAGINPGTGGLD